MKPRIFPVIAAIFAAFSATAAMASPRFGINLDGHSYYSWSANWGNIVGHFDPNMNPNSFLTGYSDGNYQVTWTGSGVPSITGGKGSYIQQTGPNSGVFYLRHDVAAGSSTRVGGEGGSFYLNTNGVSNLQVIAPDKAAGSSFRTPWLQKLDRFQPVNGQLDDGVRVNNIIRFMDWEQTNASPVRYWSDRNTGSYQTQAAGVDYKYMVEISNRNNADMWITVPHQANPADAQANNWSYNMAQYIKANLKPTLRVHVEYSNELWNGGDQAQGTYNLVQARADSQYTKPDDTGKMAQRAADMLWKHSNIFKSVLGNDRVSPVIGGFIANDYWAQWEIDWLKSKGVNLKNENYRLAIAPYVPGSATDLGEVSGDSKDVIIQKMYNFMNGNIKTWIRANKGRANAEGIPLDSYEAAIGSFYGQTNLQTHLDLQFDPRMAQIEKDFINMWDTESGGGIYNIFGLVSPYSEWGQWGLYDWTNASLAGYSPKADGVASMVVAADVVPEPSVLALAGVLLMGLCVRRRFASVIVHNSPKDDTGEKVVVDPAI